MQKLYMLMYMKHPYFKLYKILKYLGVKDYRKYAEYLLTNEEYGIMDNLMRNDVNINNNFQLGGVKEIPIKFKDIDFTISKYKDGNDILYSLFSSKNENCLTIKINKKEKKAIIMGIGYSPFCFTNEQVKHFKGKTGGSLLLQLAIKIIDEIKEHYGCKQISLVDKSYKYCYKFKIDLSKMYILMYGDTWYGKYGFIPSKNGIEDKIKIKKYAINKEIMEKTKVKHVSGLKRYIMDSYDIVSQEKNSEKVLIGKIELSNLYNEYKNEGKLLKDFIQKLLLEYDKSCLLFYLFYEALFDELELTDFHNQSYIKNI